MKYQSPYFRRVVTYVLADGGKAGTEYEAYMYAALDILHEKYSKLGCSAHRRRVYPRLLSWIKWADGVRRARHEEKEAS